MTPMLPLLAQFANAQCGDELRRQALFSNRMEPRRRVLTLIPLAVGLLFIPPLLCLGLAISNMVLEFLGLRLLNATEPSRQPGRYGTMLLLFAGSNAAYTLAAILIWQVDDPFSKAFAVSMLMFNVVLVATVRTVHLPLAVSQLVASSVVVAAGNTYFWLQNPYPIGLAVSSVSLVFGVYFGVTTMRSAHQVHAETFLERQIAEAANAAKSRFMAQMSHELRTPLNAILGMGYAEMTHAATPQAKERLTTLVSSARGLAVILDDILDLAAIDAGRLPIRPKVVDLRAEITATLALFAQQLLDARHDLRVNIPPDLPHHVQIDGQRFRQCLSNILSNAIKYTTVGTISVDVTTLAPNLLVLQISDTGPGVPTALHARVFEPFDRGTTTVAGTGLGLSISRTLARRMGGDLRLLPSTSGACFCLTVAIPPAIAPPQAMPTDLISLGQRRVLVVDDLATNRLVALAYLQIMGAVPQAVSSGTEALEVVAAAPPDIVLLDMLMADMDGLETLQRIRALPGAAGRTPVIAMTADASDDRRRACLAAGFDGYVTKPIFPEHLGAALQAIITPQHAQSDLPPNPMP